MQNEYIKFSSVTTAQRAQQVLAKNGVKARVGKNPDPKRSEGCGYAVFVDDAHSADITLKLNAIVSKGTGRWMG